MAVYTDTKIEMTRSSFDKIAEACGSAMKPEGFFFVDLRDTVQCWHYDESKKVATVSTVRK